MQQVARSIRAYIRLGRGNLAGAVEDAELALRDARAIRDPQARDPALVLAAEVARADGDAAAAHRLLDELGSPERAGGTWTVSAALLCHDLGRDAVWMLEHENAPTPWRTAARAIAEGDFARAAAVLEPTGARTLQAGVSLHGAKALAQAGRAAEAAAEIAPALAFYREVGATAYLRQADALLAEAS